MHREAVGEQDRSAQIVLAVRCHRGTHLRWRARPARAPVAVPACGFGPAEGLRGSFRCSTHSSLRGCWSVEDLPSSVLRGTVKQAVARSQGCRPPRHGSAHSQVLRTRSCRGTLRQAGADRPGGPLHSHRLYRVAHDTALLLARWMVDVRRASECRGCSARLYLTGRLKCQRQALWGVDACLASRHQSCRPGAGEIPAWSRAVPGQRMTAAAHSKVLPVCPATDAGAVYSSSSQKLGGVVKWLQHCSLLLHPLQRLWPGQTQFSAGAER